MTDEEARFDAPLVGRLLCGKWRLERLLGSGGMSSVYAGVHRNGKRVAIKVLSRDLTSNTRVRGRFVREGYIANRIGHPGTVAVLDDDADGDLVFLVMDLLEGETLAARAQRLNGRLAPEEVAYVTDRLLEVVAAAHASGIVHRDIKPENVFLTRSGEVKLLDFGIASLREISIGLNQTRNGSAIGTPGFMSPEQARGRWAEVDARTDIWAMGATMFRLLTGRPVHAVDTANEAMIAAATQPAPSLADGRPEFARALVEIVDRALAFAPAARWPSAREMQDAVIRARAELPPHLWCPPPADTGGANAATLDQESVGTMTAPTVAAPVPAALTAPLSQPALTGSGTTPLPRKRGWPLVAMAGAAVLGGAIYVGARPHPPAAVVLVAPAPAAQAPSAPRVSSEAPARAEAAPHDERPAPAPPHTRRSRSRRPGRARPAPVELAVETAPPPVRAAASEPPAPAVLPTEKSSPARTPTPPIAATPVKSDGPITSKRPREHIPPPRLLRTYQPRDGADLARVCQQVEDELVARAGVTPAFASGVTATLRHALEGSRAELYPAGMYYFIISEAALGHDREGTARSLLANHRSQALRKLSNLLVAEPQRPPMP